MDRDSDYYCSVLTNFPCYRGFFFSHVGWLLCKKHEDVIKKGKCLDLSDLRADPVLAFQRKYVIQEIWHEVSLHCFT